MAITKRLRFEILRRDNHTCRYCGGTAPDVTLTVDHVVPTALGGGDDPTNLVAACRDCNSGKSATPADAATVADVAQDAVRWAKAIEAAAELERMKQWERRDQHEQFDILWNEWGYGGPNKDRNKLPRPTNWAKSFDRLWAAGLGWDDIADAIRIAMTATHVEKVAVWRYFCGICWKKVAALHEVAKAILLAEEGQD